MKSRAVVIINNTSFIVYKMYSVLVGFVLEPKTGIGDHANEDRGVQGGLLLLQIRLLISLERLSAVIVALMR